MMYYCGEDDVLLLLVDTRIQDRGYSIRYTLSTHMNTLTVDHAIVVVPYLLLLGRDCGTRD